MKSIKLDRTIIKGDEDKLIIESKYDTPKLLYKYYQLNEHSLKPLKDNTFFFSHAYQLNDMMDGSPEFLWEMKTFIERCRKEGSVGSSVSDGEVTKK